MRTSNKPSVSTRPSRTPIGTRNVLSIHGKEPGYHYRVVNDVGDRINIFLEAGYEIVDAKDIRVGDRNINQASAEGSKAQVSVGNGVKGVVLRIKDEFYQEDQAVKQARVMELEKSLKTQVSSGKADYGKVAIEQY